MTRIPNEAGPSQPPSSFFDLAPRRSLNPVCRDVQATLSSFSFSGQVNGISETPSSGTPSSLASSSDDEYVEPSCIMNSGSRRPSVQRTSSAPEPSSSKATLFVETSAPSTLRPSLARACSESRASGVLERRRGKIASGNDKLPSNLVLDLADLPMTMGAGNLGLLRAARKAIAEPRGFDWGRVATSAPSSTANSRILTQQQHQQRSSTSSSPTRPAIVSSMVAMTPSLPASASASTTTSPESHRIAGGLSSSRSCVGSYRSTRISASEESEWDWALAGNVRATYEALRYSAYKETREPVHDIWQQLPDWVSRRSSLGGRDADLSLRGPSLHNSFVTSKPAKDQAAVAALSLSLSHATLSSQSPRSSISARGRAAQAVHIPFRVIEEVQPSDGSLSPHAQ